MELCERKGDQFGQKATYLSPNVEKLVCYQTFDNENDTETLFVVNNSISDWLHSKYLNNLEKCCALESGSFDYKQAVLSLYPFSSSMHEYMLKFTPEELYEKYKWQLEWTNKSEILLHCFVLVRSSEKGSLEASLLLVTSTLERILGDIYMVCPKTTQCPSLLKDLLQTPELKDVLGERFMFCLQVYIGPPSVLNLRNLAWHGFLSYGELQPCHVSFLLVCALSLGEEIKRNPKYKEIAAKLKDRSLIKYDIQSLLENVFPEIQVNHLKTWFHSNIFVTWSMAHMWQLAISFYQKERFGDVVMVMLPQLEHSLRRIFASCNNLPERLLTAESSEFYTTFTEILSPLLGDNTRNKLVDIIGPSFLEILLDILLHKDGPRLRDHISHGEVDLQDFPKHLADHVLNIAFAFCQKLSSNETLSDSNHLYHHIISVVDNYSSIYHPISCLRRQYSFLVNQLVQWKNLPKPIDNEFIYCEEKNLSYQSLCETLLQNVFLTVEYNYTTKEKECSNETVFQAVLEILATTKLLTLYRPKHELEIVSLLRNIVTQCLQVSSQIQQIANLRYQEWSERTLRSRQRQNYKRFWIHFPFIKETMVIMVVILLKELTDFANVVNHDEKHMKFLKRCLQYGENLASLSSPSKNRWQECSEIAKHFVEHAQTYCENLTHDSVL